MNELKIIAKIKGSLLQTRTLYDMDIDKNTGG